MRALLAQNGCRRSSRALCYRERIRRDTETLVMEYLKTSCIYVSVPELGGEIVGIDQSDTRLSTVVRTRTHEMVPDIVGSSGSPGPVPRSSESSCS